MEAKEGEVWEPTN